MEADKWYLSKRYFAALVLVASTAATVSGFDFTPDMQTILSENLAALGTAGSMIVGVIAAVWSKKNEGKKIAAAKAVEAIKK